MAVWILAVALTSVAAPACAPKRIAPAPNTGSTLPPASRTVSTLPQGRSPAGQVPAEVLFEPDPKIDEQIGPPVPEGLPEPLGEPVGGGPGHLVAELASTQVGKPYGWGGTGPERFDCSGLALYVYRQLGIALPRVSREQASTGVHVDRNELKPGDLVFFSLRSAFDHVGIFLGNNRFVHAPRRQEPVRVDNLDDAWWNRAYRGARRVFGADP